MGHAAGLEIAECLRKLLEEQEEVNVIFAAAPSQNETLRTLREQPDIDWSRVNAFHMDEYIGLDPKAPQCFSNFLEDAIFSRVPFKKVFKLNPANDPEAEIGRYTALLREYPTDIVCMGIGENGHIAFNDPGVADFNDPAAVKRAALDEVCRTQQVHDGCFAALDEVPKEALTLTVPTLMAGKHLFCMVPAATKRQAVTRMLTEEITPDCPCTILRRHADATLYCDFDSLQDFVK
ncbi:MAG: glucosamine-6-phosphate deaminase [Clostridia bacterium]|nr:glucosamine-6-phosphate deaminase [Clostridia bacterium]